MTLTINQVLEDADEETDPLIADCLAHAYAKAIAAGSIN